MASSDVLPAGWSVYERESDGQWVGSHYGPHGVTVQLSDASHDGLVAKIVAREEYRVASGVTARPATAFKEMP